jgi:hypothetical protein
MDAQTRKQLAIKRGVRVGLTGLVRQLVAQGDSVSLEAAGLLALAAARLAREEARRTAQEARFTGSREA